MAVLLIYFVSFELRIMNWLYNKNQTNVQFYKLIFNFYPFKYEALTALFEDPVPSAQ